MSSESGVAKDVGESDGYAGAGYVLAASVTIGAVGSVCYAAQASTLGQMLSICGTAAAAAAAFLLVGSIFGFLFGVPRSLQKDGETPRDAADGQPAAYQANTNLEHISDWLAKILVGVGLTQLGRVPGELRDLGEYVAKGLGGLPGSQVFGTSLVIGCLMVGFLGGYLWTRLNLARLFRQADFRARLRRAVSSRENALVEAIVDGAGEARLKPPRILWVDDRSTNNKNVERLLEQTFSAQFVHSLSTEDALSRLKNDPAYDLVISDLGRPGDPKAGYTLLDRMQEQKVAVPVVLFTGTSSPAIEQEARRRGAVGSTDSVSGLIALVRRALGFERHA